MNTLIVFTLALTLAIIVFRTLDSAKIKRLSYTLFVITLFVVASLMVSLIYFGYLTDLRGNYNEEEVVSDLAIEAYTINNDTNSDIALDTFKGVTQVVIEQINVEDNLRELLKSSYSESIVDVYKVDEEENYILIDINNLEYGLKRYRINYSYSVSLGVYDWYPTSKLE